MKVLMLIYLFTIAYSYDDISDDFDVDNVFNNPEIEKKYIDCFVDKGPCTDSMKLQKSHIKEVLEDACQECTPIQKSKTIAALKVLVEKYPNHLMEMRSKYDPDGKYSESFLKLLTEN